MLRDLTEKIVVHAPDKSSGHRQQKVDNYTPSWASLPPPTRSLNGKEKQRDSINHHAAFLKTEKLGYGLPAMGPGTFKIRFSDDWRNAYFT